MAEPVFQVIDDLAPAELFTQARTVCAGNGWFFGHGSNHIDNLPFWKMDLDGDATFDAIWRHAQEYCEALAGARLRVIRQYANGHTYGLGGKPHVDDSRPGSYTLLYYPMEEWKDGWDGETVFFDNEGEIASAVRPRPNRAVFFDSRIVHAGRAPSRICPALRVSVAYKLEAIAPVQAEEPAVAVEETEPVSPTGMRMEETAREGAQRTYAVHVDAAVVMARKQEQLASLGQTVRLPGFRPGKIPATVLEQRYGAKTRAAVLNRLMEEAADSLVIHGSVAAAMGTVRGGLSGDVELRLTVTHLPDLPAIHFEDLELERLTAGEAELQELGATAVDAEQILTDHLRQQVLDYLNVFYDFPLAAALVEREFATIWNSAAAQIEAEATSPAAREEITTELREIAERRVRLGAVVAEMARRYEIRPSEEDLRDAHLEGETLAQTRRRLTESRAMDLAISLARVTERKATLDELRDLTST
jgi:hypothetical protein